MKKGRVAFWGVGVATALACSSGGGSTCPCPGDDASADAITADAAKPPKDAGPKPPLGPWASLGATLATDPGGWAFHSALGAASDGTLYATWSEHAAPGTDEDVGIRVTRWNGSAWALLGARIGHARNISAHVEAYAPSIAIVGTTPYVAWYEGGGYGWYTSSSTTIHTSVFVSHWDGTSWVADGDAANANGSVSASNADGADAHNPALAVIGGKLHCAYVVSTGSIVVRRLEGSGWVDVGSIAAGSRIVDMTLADVGGAAHVTWAESAAGSVKVAKLDNGAWTPLGGAVDSGLSVGVALADRGGVPYVVFQERASGDADQIRVRHFDGSSWVSDGDALNFDASRAAGHPTIAAAGSDVWIAWPESSPGDAADLVTRGLTNGSWSPAEAIGRVGAGGADGPSLVVVNGVPTVSWGERDPASSTKQVYVKWRGAAVATSEPAHPHFGADGAPPAITPNTWIGLAPGGVASAPNVGDEGYSSLAYDPITRRAYVLGKYHGGPTMTSGEDQNALLAYDFSHNRWDLWEVVEDAASEHLGGVGHDEGATTIDTVHGLYLSVGNLTLNAGAGWQTYAYDLGAGRGRRMVPAQQPSRSDSSASAFDPDDDLMLRVSGYQDMAWTYRHASNTWTQIANSPTPRESPSLVYDTKDHLFIMYGGHVDESSPAFKETWTFDPASSTWALRPANGAMPPAGGFMAFDSKHDVAVLIPIGTSTAWLYHPSTNVWSTLPAPPAGVASYTQGQLLTYDSDDDVFLLHSGTWLTALLAFRYAP